MIQYTARILLLLMKIIENVQDKTEIKVSNSLNYNGIEGSHQTTLMFKGQKYTLSIKPQIKKDIVAQAEDIINEKK